MTNEQLLALDAYSSNSFLMVNKQLISTFGLNTAVFLSNLVDKFKYFQKEDKLNDDNSFFLTMEQQVDQTGLSTRVLRKSKRELLEKNIINTYMKGIPPKEFYIINFAELIDITIEKTVRNIPIKTVRNKGSETVRNYPVKTVRNIKENKYKENKYKENKLKEESIKTTSSDDSKKRKIKPSPETIKKIISEFNKIASSCELPKVLKITSDRTTKIRSRAKSLNLYSADSWKEVFNKISESEFLCGQNNRGWTINFDWIIHSDKNLSKVLEDNFKDKPKRKRKKTGASNIPGKYEGIADMKIKVEKIEGLDEK